MSTAAVRVGSSVNSDLRGGGSNPASPPPRPLPPGGSAGGEGVTRRPIFPTPPPLGCRDGRGGSGRGRPTCRAGGGGVNPTSMAQNDTHVALIILTTQMWGGGGDYWWKKLFRAKILCSCAFGANIRSYTKQRARHGTPFLQPPPPPSAGVHVTPPPPPPQSNFQVAPLPPALVQALLAALGPPGRRPRPQAQGGAEAGVEVHQPVHPQQPRRAAQDRPPLEQPPALRPQGQGRRPGARRGGAGGREVRRARAPQPRAEPAVQGPQEGQAREGEEVVAVGERPEVAGLDLQEVPAVRQERGGGDEARQEVEHGEAPQLLRRGARVRPTAGRGAHADEAQKRGCQAQRRVHGPQEDARAQQRARARDAAAAVRERRVDGVRVEGEGGGAGAAAQGLQPPREGPAEGQGPAEDGDEGVEGEQHGDAAQDGEGEVGGREVADSLVEGGAVVGAGGGQGHPVPGLRGEVRGGGPGHEPPHARPERVGGLV